MGQPFLGEIKIMSFGFAPRNWAMCNGQFLPINQNQALFSLLGTTYGGNGQTTFALPDLRGQTPIHQGSQNTIGTKGGEQNHTLSINELPTHFHIAQGYSQNGDQVVPTGNTLGTVNNLFSGPGAGNQVVLNAGTIGNNGGSQPHLNMQPFLTLTFCIALIGIFPSHN
jgi:microcystin-dependent protein